MPTKKTVTKQKTTRKRSKRSMEKELKRHDFRVTIFGSARIKQEDEIYVQVFDLAKTVGSHKFDVVTGGGPGLMEAANAGHAIGDKTEAADSIGLVIKLPWENSGNKHLEIKKEFNKFSNRLDTFMKLSKAVVVYPGGIGTCLELFYTWQLIQVKHIKPIPIILVGNMWNQLIEWVKKHPLKNKLLSPENMNCIHIVKDNKAAMRVIMNTYKKFKRPGKKAKKK